MKRLYPIALAVGALCFVFQSANATLLFSDSFSYDPGVLGGLVNPGNSLAWQGGNSGLAVVSGNLTYSGLADSGGNELQISQGTAGTVYNTFANQTSGQVYYSFLFNAAAADSANNYFTALNAGNNTPNGGSDAIDAYFYASGKMEMRANPAAATAGTGVALTLNQTYLIVEMIDLTGHTASLWVDPDSSTFGALSAPTATATLSGLTASGSYGSGGGSYGNIDNIGFKAQSAAGGPYLVDNVLIGTSWADVTPAGIPEPSILALAGMSIFGLITSVRSRMRR